MNTDISDMYVQAELALAAYADLLPGTPDVTKLQGPAGMSQSQATQFSKRWKVVEQYDGKVEEAYVDEFGQEHTFLNPTGLSVTLFEEIGSGRQVVAIRGTQSSFPDWMSDWATNIVDIGLLGTPEHQNQYRALSDQANTWLNDGTLHTGFDVSGHSLGGFLAAGLAMEFPGQVGAAYLYNAPGLGRLTGDVSVAAQVWRALSPDGLGEPSDGAPIHNIVAAWDPVSEVGLPISPEVMIDIDQQQ